MTTDDIGGTVMASISTSTADHYTWGAGCDGWHMVNRPELSLIQACGPWPVQLRHQTKLTSEQYVTQKAWRQADAQMPYTGGSGRIPGSGSNPGGAA